MLKKKVEKIKKEPKKRVKKVVEVSTDEPKKTKSKKVKKNERQYDDKGLVEWKEHEQIDNYQLGFVKKKKSFGLEKLDDGYRLTSNITRKVHFCTSLIEAKELADSQVEK